jgi:hypothetical protein
MFGRVLNLGKLCKVFLESEREKMTVNVSQVHQTIDQLTSEQLAQVWEYLVQLMQKQTVPLYHLHEQAIATGVADLAEQHDHYLYGQVKSDA